MLSFKTTEEFYNLIEAMGQMSFNQRANYFANSSTKTLLSYYYDILNELEQAENEKSESKYKNLLDENNDIITINDDEIKLKIENPLITGLINRNGMVEVEGQIWLYTEKERIIYFGDDVSDFLSELEKNDPSGNKLVRHPYLITDLKNTAAACGTYQTVTAINDDRKAVYEAQMLLEYSIVSQSSSACNYQPLYLFKGYAVSTGTPYKKNIWGNWKNYKTINRLDLHYRAYLYGYDPLTLQQWYKTTNYYHEDSSEEYNIVYWDLVHQGQGCWSENGNYQGYFGWIDPNRYCHRGMNNIWASVTCE